MVELWIAFDCVSNGIIDPAVDAFTGNRLDSTKDCNVDGVVDANLDCVIDLREFVLTHIILAPGARGRVVPSRGS